MAADVLDSSDVKTYLRRFLRASKGKGRIWGLHNYKDVNRHQSKGVKNVLSVVKGKVWLTETGGIVNFKPSFKYNLKRAASATKYMFKLARRYKRMERIYVYRYFGEPRSARFDAGLVNPTGRRDPRSSSSRRASRDCPARHPADGRGHALACPRQCRASTSTPTRRPGPRRRCGG